MFKKPFAVMSAAALAASVLSAIPVSARGGELDNSGGWGYMAFVSSGLLLVLGLAGMLLAPILVLILVKLREWGYSRLWR